MEKNHGGLFLVDELLLVRIFGSQIVLVYRRPKTLTVALFGRHTIGVPLLGSSYQFGWLTLKNVTTFSGGTPCLSNIEWRDSESDSEATTILS